MSASDSRSAASPRRKAKRTPKRAGELISEEGYARLLHDQEGVCAICGNKPKTRRLSVDHNHRTGKVRGLLCFRCNRNLPTYTNSEWLSRALEYVLRDEYPGRSRTPRPDPDAELDQWADAR